MENPDISIVIPVYNDEENILELHRRLEQVLGKEKRSYEVIAINDGSVDNSSHLLKSIQEKDKRWRVFEFSRNFGHQIALTAGIDFAEGNCIIIIDDDLQDPPELIPNLLEKWDNGYKIVNTQRRLRKGESWLKKTSARFFYWLLRKLSKTNIQLNVGDFCLIDKQVINVIREMKEQHKFFRGMIPWTGFNQTTILYDRDPRFGGKSSYTFSKLMRLAIDGITAFSTFPLKVSMYLGFIIACVGFILMFYFMVLKLVYKITPQGWASIITAILFIGGIQLIGIGIIGEYVARIYEESKKRPLYVIKKN